MKVVKKSIVDKIHDETGALLDVYKFESYHFDFGGYFYSAKSYVDEPGKITIAGLIFQAGNPPRELAVVDWNSTDMCEIVAYLKYRGMKKIQVLTDEGDQIYPLDKLAPQPRV